jgi:Family of unknown function (DUF6236)
MTADRFGLYYPEMRFDRDWLRLGALYWPKLARIVPPGFLPDDDEDTRLLIDELDFVVNVAPDDAAAAIAETLLGLLNDHGEELVRRYAFRPADVHSISWDDSWLAEVHTARGVHPMKVDSRVRDALATMGLAHQAGELAPWLLMESRLADIYMCVLAEEIARQNRVLQPVTNFGGFYVAAGGWTLERLVYALLAPERYHAPERDPGDAASAIALLALEMVIPVPEGGARWSLPPMEKIVQIRQRHGAEFAAFRLEVEAVAAEVARELTQVRDPAVLDSYLRHIADSRLVQPAHELRRALKGMRVDVATQAVTLKFEVPALATLVAGGAAAHQPLLAGGAAIAAGLLGLRMATRRSKAEVTSPSAASYLLETFTSLGPRRGVEALMDGFRRVGANTLKHHDRPYLGGTL